MRITGGIFKGREIKTLKLKSLRPATDMLRQAVFNVIGEGAVAGKGVIDLFAGSGAYGIESLSRGAEFVVFVEQNPRCCELIKKNVSAIGMENHSKVVQMDVFNFFKKPAMLRSVFLLFADPPYHKNILQKLTELIDRSKILVDDGIMILEHSKREVSVASAGRLQRFFYREYGDSAISIYRNTGK